MIDRFKALKEKYNDTLSQYGAVVIIVWFTLFFATWGGFWLAIRAGFQPSGALAGAGTVGAAYAATQLSKPLRFMLTIALTPAVSAAYNRLRGRDPLHPSQPADPADQADAPSQP